MSKTFSLIALLLAATFCIAGESRAQSGSAQRGSGMMCLDRFSSMDTNKDGLVDRGEFRIRFA